MEQIQATATFPNIAADNVTEFKQIAAEVLEAVRREEGTLQFDWFFSEDDSQCVVRETYSSSDAVLAHLGNVGQLVEKLVGLGGGLKLEVYGEPSATLRKAIEALQPSIYSYVQGK